MTPLANQSVNFINPWSWETAIKKVLGNEASVNTLWNEYQSDLASGKITQIDAELKELRDKKETIGYSNE